MNSPTPYQWGGPLAMSAIIPNVNPATAWLEGVPSELRGTDPASYSGAVRDAFASLTPPAPTQVGEAQAGFDPFGIGDKVADAGHQVASYVGLILLGLLIVGAGLYILVKEA